MTRVSLFDYDLPEDLIAAVPAERRDESRLMVLDRASGGVAHRRFFDLPELLRDGDLLVMNDARVLPARLNARRATGGAVELLLVRPEGGEGRWLAMLRSSGSLREGEVLTGEEGAPDVTLVESRGQGCWLVEVPGPLSGGRMPLPPYIVRQRRRPGPARADARARRRALPDRLRPPRRRRGRARRPDCTSPTSCSPASASAASRCARSACSSGRAPSGRSSARRCEDHALDAEFYHLPAETGRGRAHRAGRGPARRRHRHDLLPRPGARRPHAAVSRSTRAGRTSSSTRRSSSAPSAPSSPTSTCPAARC